MCSCGGVALAPVRGGRFELRGIDRIRVRDGRVAENVIVFGTAQFEQLTGLVWPRA
jgi:hypothetical protein